MDGGPPTAGLEARRSREGTVADGSQSAEAPSGLDVPMTPGDVLTPEEDLTAATVSGGAWRAASVFGGAAMQFVVSIVLARLLTPSDFGTVSLVGIVVGVANVLAFLGAGPALVQRRELTSDHVATAWTLSVIGGLAACVVIAAAAPLLALAVGDSATTVVFMAVSPVLFLTGLRTCSMGLMRRKMRFRALMTVDLTSYALGYALVAVPTALLGWGVWSLVAGQLCQGVVACVVAYVVQPHPLRFRLESGATREMLHFGGGVTASSLANYVAVNSDNFMVGRILGTGALGLYARAYTLMNLPLTYVAQVLSQVLLPAYSRVQDDRARMTRGYLASVYLVFGIAAPAMMFVLVGAPYLIRTLYGAQWEGAIGALQVLALFGALRATYHLGGSAVQASGKPWSEFRRQVMYACLVLIGAAVGSRWGIVGVAWGIGLAIVVMYAAIARLTHALLRFSWRSFAAAHATGVTSGLGVLGFGLALRWALQGTAWPDVVILLSLGIASVGLAFVVVSLLPRSWRAEGAERVVSVALDKLPRRLGAPLRRGLRLPG